MSFFHWRHNVVDFKTARPLFLGFFALSLLIIFILWIYRDSINRYLNKEGKKFIFNKLDLDQLFVVIGATALFFNVIRLIFLFAIDFPWKSEIIPLQLCRFFTFFIPILFLFKKGHYIKMFSIIAIIGAIMGFAFANLGVIKQFVEDDRLYNNLQPGTVEYQKAGFNVGYDNIMYWDFILAHSFILIISVFTHIAYGEKAKINLFYLIRGAIYILIYTFALFFLNWIFNSIGMASSNPKVKVGLDANWLYLGQAGISVLGPLSKWPVALPVFIVFGIIIYLLICGLYLVLTAIKFETNGIYIKRVRFVNIKENFKKYEIPLKDCWKFLKLT
ncbi:TMEM164 family acyltransferase [Mycoplasmopsis edwardii]|nr:YwaF family protein [Mycoplasmopsis edwardii]